MDQEFLPNPVSRPPPELTPELEDLVFEYLERIDGARTELLETLCREHPEQADLLRARVHVLRRVHGL